MTAAVPRLSARERWWSGPAAARLVGREAWLVLAGGLALFGAAVGLARYGLDPSDEGYIVYSAVEVAAGRVPYRDLNSLYTPLSWYLHAALFKLVGVDLVALRVWFALVAAGLAVGVYLHARQLMSPRLALLPVASFVLLFPVPQNWAPYPAWYALGGLLVSLLALGRWLEDRRARWLVAAGAGCAVAFACKSNLGLLGLLACCGFLLLQAAPLFGASGTTSTADRAGDRGRWVLAALQVAFVGACGGALWLVVHGVATPGNVLLLVGPVVLVGLVLVGPPGAWASAVLLTSVVRSGTWVILAFLVGTLPWYLALSAVAGWQATFDSVFVAGARTAWAFYEPLVPPNRDALEGIAWIAGGLAAVGLFGRLGRAGRLSAGRVLLVVLALVGVLAAALVWRSLVEHQSLPSYLADNLWARWVRTAAAPNDLPRLLPFLAEAAGLALLLRSRLASLPARSFARTPSPVAAGATSSSEPRSPVVPAASPVRPVGSARRGERNPRPLATYDLRLGLLVWFCVLFVFQLYPHASYLHVLFSWGPFLVLLGALAAEVWRSAEPYLARLGWRWVSYALLAVLPVLLVPNAWRGRATVIQQTVPLGLQAAPQVQAKTDDAARLRMVEARTATLAPDAPLFAYPEVAMVYVLTGHPNPTRENYLATGYVDQAGQQAIVDRLEATQTRFVVWDREGARRLESNAWYTTLTDYLRRAYAPVAEQDDWLLMERVAPQAAPPSAGAATPVGRQRPDPPRSPG